MKRAKQKGERFVVDRRGEPQVVIMGVEDYFKHFASETKTMAAIRQEAQQKGLNKLTTRDMDQLIKKTRQERRDRRAPKASSRNNRSSCREGTPHPGPSIAAATEGRVYSRLVPSPLGGEGLEFLHYLPQMVGGPGSVLPPNLRKGSAFPKGREYYNSQARLRLSPAAMPTINKDTPCLLITTVTRNRLPVFRTDALKGVACRALDEARRSGGFALFAYVIMPEHLHVLADGTLQASETLRYVNGILSRRVIVYLKEGGFATSLEKLRGAPKGRRHQYSLVDHHSNALPVFSERFFMQKVNYIHLNPVRAGLVARGEDYRWSSARCWSGRVVEDEPLRMDLEKILWRRPP